MESKLEKLKYPVGKFNPPEAYSQNYIKERINEIAGFPAELKKEVFNLSNDQLNTPYRENGWTVRQVIHHCSDSHMNCFIRIKWVLTEATPIIKSYDENVWATLQDSLTMSIEPTLNLLEGLHYRMAYLMQNLSLDDLEKKFIHPDNNKEFTIKEIIATYAWHGKHHLAHITELKKLKNWS
jgi:hypothetical protein